MSQETVSITLGIWSALLSTSLAGIKLAEVWRDRVRLSTSYEFSIPGYGGNKIIIENPSKLPVMISYWELLWQRRRFLKWEVTGGKFPNEGYCNITIGAHSRHTLTFEGEDYFEWSGASIITKGQLYLKLYVIGRNRPILLKVYNPRKPPAGLPVIAQK